MYELIDAIAFACSAPSLCGTEKMSNHTKPRRKALARLAPYVCTAPPCGNTSSSPAAASQQRLEERKLGVRRTQPSPIRCERHDALATRPAYRGCLRVRAEPFPRLRSATGSTYIGHCRSAADDGVDDMPAKINV